MRQRAFFHRERKEHMKTRNLITGFAIAVAWLALDQVTKTAVLRTLYRGDVVEVTSFFNVVLLFNPGVSFGMLGASGLGPSVLSAGALIIVIGLTVWLVRAESKVTVVALGLIIGGALGNVADRLRQGAVTDFLDFHLAGWHWPAFNAADVGVVCGVAILLLEGFLVRDPSGEKMSDEARPP